MWSLTIKSIIRTNLRNWKFSLIIVLGLAMAFMAFLFISQYVIYEKSYDSFYEDSRHVYRINRSFYSEGELAYHGVSSPRGIYYSKNEVPEIEQCSYTFLENMHVIFEDQVIYEQNILWVGEDYEKVFIFDMLKGVASFDRSDVAVLSESKAKAIFGDSDPLGKIIKIGGGMPVEIIGICKDLPSNSHIQTDYFVSIRTWVRYGWIRDIGKWDVNWYSVYVKLKPTTKSDIVEDKLDLLVKNKIPDLDQLNQELKFHLQPITDIHFTHDLQNDSGQKTKRSSLLTLILLGVFVLLIAWINYLSMSIAIALKKEKSLGMLRVVGAGKNQLWLQAVLDSILLNSIALIIALVANSFLFDKLCQYFDIPLNTGHISMKLVLGGFILICLIGILLSSSYTAVSLSKIGHFVGKKKFNDNNTRKILVIVQLCIANAFISSTILIHKQIRYTQTCDLGFDIEQVVVLNAPVSFNGEETYMDIDYPKINRFRDFRNALYQSPEVVAMTASYTVPGRVPGRNNQVLTRSDDNTNSGRRITIIGADDEYVKTFDIELLAGRDFSNHREAYRTEVIINEKTRKALNFESPQDAIGAKVHYYNHELTVVGVVKNYHNEGLQKQIYPLGLYMDHPSEFGYYPVRVTTRDMNATMAYIEETWDKYYPADPFYYFFQEDSYNEQYRSENRFAKINLILAILSILICCMNLYGVILNYIIHRTKEIGLRKVNGAKVSDILVFINKDILVWIAIALVISLPISYYFLALWLENFAFKTGLSWWVFVVSGLLIVAISLLTVSWQSWKASIRNPVEALRYE